MHQALNQLSVKIGHDHIRLTKEFLHYLLRRPHFGAHKN